MARGAIGVTRFGVFVNNRAAVFVGDRFSIADLVELAVAVERSGLDFVSVGDSILAKPRWSPVAVLAAIAARTERVELTTGILQPHLRNPVLLAQEWATLDALAGGRTSLGVGLGTGPRSDVEAEYRLVGLDVTRRGSAFEDSIVALRRLWSGAPVTLDGAVIRLTDVSIGLPVRAPPPRILIACGGLMPTRAGVGPGDVFDPQLAGTVHGPWDRVARLGDGWITGIVTPAEFASAWSTIDDLAAGRGRDLATSFERRLNCFIHVADDPARARRDGVDFMQRYHRRDFDDATVDRWLIHGPAAACAERIDEYSGAGVTSFQLVLADDDQAAQLERVVDVISRVAGDVGASV